MRVVSSINKTTAALLLAAFLIVPLESGYALQRRAASGEVGGINYVVPADYRASASKGGLYVEASLPDWGPWQYTQPGWDDHLQILVTESLGESISTMWGRLYDGTPRVPAKQYVIVSTHRIEPDLTVLTMASGDEVFLPDQDRTVLPEGFLVCGQPKPAVFPHASCAYYFNEGAQRWQVRFGRQFVRDFKDIRAKAQNFIHQFEER
ncbi:hypothetical protein FG152_17100 [Ochrobactrum sp. XJ1]|nr:hypothetical protein [Ochrobactrum sp. XJ1]